MCIRDSLYPEYTGTGWNAVLKHDDTYDESMFDTMQQEYESQLGLTWVGMYGFNNTYGLAVSRDAAERYNLRTYSCLLYTSPRTKSCAPSWLSRLFMLFDKPCRER